MAVKVKDTNVFKGSLINLLNKFVINTLPNTLYIQI